jgi:hypothetical protein
MNFVSFFETASLNEEITISSTDVLFLERFNNIAFSNNCLICKKTTTFKTNIDQCSISEFEISEQVMGHTSIGHNSARIKYFNLKSKMYYLDHDRNRNINFSFMIKCQCQQCKIHHTYFLINVQSNSSIAYSNEHNLFKKDSLPNFILSKRGIYPFQDLKLNKKVQKFLDRESNSWYYKGNKSLNEGLAIGAFAYFRRIIEKELLHIAEFVQKGNPDKNDEINTLIREYNSSGKKASILYEGIFKYLPTSLQGLGDNPIKKLYNKTSGGLHEFDEDKCMELSKSINTLLEFVIEKLYEEREEVSNIKKILKGL